MKTKKRVRVNWYRLLYSLKDDKLIAFFWKWFNSHKVKSKQRAARFVLIRYYSTTPCPKSVLKYFDLSQNVKVCDLNISKEFYGLL